jgi:beta-galactosidase
MVMNRRTALLATGAASFTALALPARAQRPTPTQGRSITAFDDDWRFLRGDPAGAQSVQFDDQAWRDVQLPHDWSIEDVPGAPKTSAPWTPPTAVWQETALVGPTKPKTPMQVTYPAQATPGGPPLRVGPFDPEAGASGWGTGWVVGGVGWYRKAFLAPDLAKGERVELLFDGAFSETQVWINGALAGSNVYGYGSFAIDLTPHLAPSKPNIVAVRVANEGETARWYSGSGINQHVWLTVTGPVRVAPFGVAVVTPRISAEAADVEIQFDLESYLAAPASVEVVARVRDASGRAAGEGRARMDMAPAGKGNWRLSLDLARPKLWNPESPHLYTVELSVLADGRVTDRVSTRFGVRSISVTPERGLLINDRPVKLKGACIHADHGILGAVAIDAAEIRKVELLKRHGYNAIRLAHNMYPPKLLETCDALGMVVIDEVFDVWEKSKYFADDFSQHFKQNWRACVEHMVRRDRNHPSVVFWSIGNEIVEANTPRGYEIAADLRKAILALDQSRPITAALTGQSGKKGKAARQSLDVVGYNYEHIAYEPDHAAEPNLVFMSTEQNAQNIHDSWRVAQAHPWVLGDFVWTGIDYLGEVGAGSSLLRKTNDKPIFPMFLWDYPAFQSGCGELDILGQRKPQGLYRDVLWSRSPLELLVQRPTPEGFIEKLTPWGWPDELESWTWSQAKGRAMTVRAYTAGDEVRLKLNGREVGRKSVASTDKLTAAFEVPYEPGDLVAIALRDGREIGRKRLTTVGEPARLRLRAERLRLRASPNELAYVFAEVCDAKGRKSPDAAVDLTFSLEGEGRLRATGSANPRGLKSFTDPRARTFHGEALAIIQPRNRPGRATVRVSAPGLTGDALTLRLE